MHGARGVRGHLAAQVQGQLGDFFSAANSPHGLAIKELLVDPGFVDALLRSLGGNALSQRRRLHGAWANRIAANALADKVGGDCLGQPHHRRFACSVGKSVGHAFDTRDHRRHVDDRTTPSLQHAGHKCADHAVHGGDIDIHRTRPGLFVTVENVAAVHVACAVEQHVQCTDALTDCADGLGRCHIQGDRGYAFKSFQPADIDVRGKHLGTRPGKGNGAGLADALPRCRDQHAPVLQVHAASSFASMVAAFGVLPSIDAGMARISAPLTNRQMAKT
ncbi:hypothetical protein D3C76_890130 [compost metagenome]